jgi:hypothetical protein
LDKQKDQAVARSACGVAARIWAMTALCRATDGGYDEEAAMMKNLRDLS